MARLLSGYKEAKRFVLRGPILMFAVFAFYRLLPETGLRITKKVALL
jgi:hypothetical protein